MLAGVVLAAAAAMPSCWDVYDAALAHSARLQRPAYLTYVENIDMQYGDQNATTAVKGSRYKGFAKVEYRDDGMARVEDERFGNEPIVTEALDPGPPELGPYGTRRNFWMGMPDAIPVIASVRSKGSVSCTLRAQPYEGRQTYHLSFRGASSRIPHVDDLWVDTQTHDIWKVALDAPLNFYDEQWKSVDLAHFEIELGYQGRYLLVRNVTWETDVPASSQTMHIFAQYAFTNYAFPASLPAQLFVPPAAPGD